MRRNFNDCLHLQHHHRHAGCSINRTQGRRGNEQYGYNSAPHACRRYWTNNDFNEIAAQNRRKAIEYTTNQRG